MTDILSRPSGKGKRSYRCDLCGHVAVLAAGNHWHRCGGFETRMSDVVISESVARAVGPMVRALKVRRG